MHRRTGISFASLSLLMVALHSAAGQEKGCSWARVDGKSQIHFFQDGNVVFAVAEDVRTSPGQSEASPLK